MLSRDQVPFPARSRSRATLATAAARRNRLALFGLSLCTATAFVACDSDHARTRAGRGGLAPGAATNARGHAASPAPADFALRRGRPNTTGAREVIAHPATPAEVGLLAFDVVKALQAADKTSLAASLVEPGRWDSDLFREALDIPAGAAGAALVDDYLNARAGLVEQWLKRMASHQYIIEEVDVAWVEITPNARVYRGIAVQVHEAGGTSIRLNLLDAVIEDRAERRFDLAGLLPVEPSG